VTVEEVEAAIFERVECDVLAHAPHPDAEIATQLTRAEGALDGLDRQVDAILDTLLDTPKSAALQVRLAEAEAARKEQREALSNLREWAGGGGDAAVVALRVGNVGELIGEGQASDRAALNAAMLRLFDHVVVDVAAGTLRFAWKHAPEAETASLFWAWPKTG